MGKGNQLPESWQQYVERNLFGESFGLFAANGFVRVGGSLNIEDLQVAKKVMTMSDYNLLDLKLANINNWKDDVQTACGDAAKDFAMKKLKDAVGCLNEWLAGFG